MSAPVETHVPMGAWAATASRGDVLWCVGIGSCIALLLVDLDKSVAGIAHVVLPEGDGRPAVRYGNTVVPELVARTVSCGARRDHLRAALVGGAAMFTFGGSGQQIGFRNERSVRQGLLQAQIPVVAATTGGRFGRTLWATIGARVTATVRTSDHGQSELGLDQARAKVGTTSFGEGSPAVLANRTEITEEVVN